MDLHSIVTRGTKELSSTLQEFRGVRILQRSNKISTVAEDQTDRGDWNAGRSSPKMSSMSQEQLLPKSPVEESKLIKPLVMQFHLVIYFSSPTKKIVSNISDTCVMMTCGYFLFLLLITIGSTLITFSVVAT